MDLVFSIFNFFINKIALANIWMGFSCSNLALYVYIVAADSRFTWCGCECGFYFSADSIGKHILIWRLQEVHTFFMIAVYLITWRTYSIYIFICHLNWKTCNKHLVNVNWPGAVVNFWKLTCFSQLNSCFVDVFPKLTIKVSL